jgi:AcrR family transcriptional regulator
MSDASHDGKPEKPATSRSLNTFLQVVQGFQPQADLGVGGSSITEPQGTASLVSSSPGAEVLSNGESEDKGLGRRARERSQRRREILEVARQHFARGGYTGTTLESIAKVAEFAKPTLYQFFSSKEHLFHSILMDGYQDLLGIQRKAINGESDAASQLRTLCIMFLIYYRKHLDFYILHRQFQHRLRQAADNPWHENSRKLNQEIRDKVRGLLARGMSDGDFIPMDSERLCSVFLESLSIYTQAFQDGGELRTATEMADEIMRLFLDGIRQRG